MNSFASALWDQVPAVLRHSQERRREIDSFIDVLNQRISAEESYAKSVEETARMADRIRQGEQSVSSLAFSCFKFDCVNRSAQARIFSKCIKEEILIPLKDLASSQSQEAREVEKKYKKLEKELNEIQTQITKVENKFSEEYKEREETIITNEILLRSSRISKEKRVKVLMKSNDIVKSLAEYQLTHDGLVSRYNSFLGEYHSGIEQILQVYQGHEEVRLGRQEESIMKMLIFGTSMIKNFQYDIVTITSQVEKAKEINQINNFIDDHKTGQPKLEVKPNGIDKDIMAHCLLRMNSKTFQNGINLLTNKDLKIYVEKSFKEEETGCSLFEQGALDEFTEIRKIISSVWGGESMELEQIQRIKQLLGDQINRLVLYLYLQQYLLTLNVIISEKSHQQVLFLIFQVLNICQIHQDVFVARKIVNLTFSFYTLRDDQKYYLHQSLNDFRLIKQVDFWKATILESIQEELFTHLSNYEEEEFEMRKLSLIIGQLAMYSHQMILLGVSSKAVRQMIGYFCRVYNVTEDRNRDLSKTISQSVKKYQELFSMAETTISVESNPSDRKWSLDQINESQIPSQPQPNIKQEQHKESPEIPSKEQKMPEPQEQTH